MTHGEVWIDAVSRRIAGYCKTRGFRSSGALVVSPMFPMSRMPQYEYDIRDMLGNCVCVCVQMHVERGSFIDGGGQVISEVSATTFDTLTEKLTRRVLLSKKQLGMDL